MYCFFGEMSASPKIVRIKGGQIKIAAHDLLTLLSTQFTLLGILKDDCMDFHKKYGEYLELIDSLEATN